MRYISCNDRMCGADDCPNCHPENFRGGRCMYDLDLEEIKEEIAEFIPEDEGERE